MCGRVHQNGPDLPGIRSEMDASEEELARAYKENRNGAPGEWFWIIRRHPGHARSSCQSPSLFRPVRRRTRQTDAREPYAGSSTLGAGKARRD